MINQSNLDKLVKAALKQRKELCESNFDGIKNILKNFSNESDTTISVSKKIRIEMETVQSQNRLRNTQDDPQKQEQQHTYFKRRRVGEGNNYQPTRAQNSEDSPASSASGESISGESSSNEYSKFKAILSSLKNQNSTILKCKDNHGRNLLYLACLANDLKLIQLLLEFGASEKDFLVEDEAGLSPILILLHHFKETSDSSILCYLFTNKILKINARYVNDATLLHFAAFNDNNDLCQLLLLLEANVDENDADENTPLHYAAMQDSAEVAEALLSSNAQQKTNKKAETPSRIANLYSSEKVLSLLAVYKSDDCEGTQASKMQKNETLDFEKNKVEKFANNKRHDNILQNSDARNKTPSDSSEWSLGMRLSRSFSEGTRMFSQAKEEELVPNLQTNIFRSISASSSPTKLFRYLNDNSPLDRQQQFKELGTPVPPQRNLKRKKEPRGRHI